VGPLFWLILVVIIVALAATTGLKPKDGRHVARTQLMGAARVALVVFVLVLAYIAFRARG
jgi:hypothetical protein